MTFVAYLVLGTALMILGFVLFVRDKTPHQFVVMTLMLLMNTIFGAVLALSYLGVLWPQTN
jgi:hypothetical protein